MPRGFDKKDLSKGNPEDANERPTRNQSIAIDPALLETQDSTAGETQNSRQRYGRSLGDSSHQATQRPASSNHVAQRPSASNPVTQRPSRALPTSRDDMRRRRELRASSRTDVANSANSSIPSAQSNHQEPRQGSSTYPDPELIGHGSLRDRFLQSRAVSGSDAVPTTPQSQPEAGGSVQEETRKAVKRSKKRTGIDAGLSADAEENLGDAAPDSRRLSRGSKRRKTTPKDDNADVERESKTRKTSKLQIKIAEGKAPKRGSLGPDGEIRVRGCQLQFRDINNPEWTPAAYHNDYRRQFLDEADEEGEFDYPPTQGEADDDETSYQPEQQSWGPSREDWQNIVNAEGQKVMFLVDKPKSRRPPQEPGNWIHEGRVLLDRKNHPVKDWPGLNKTLSTEIESWRWEALMRMYPWLNVADLLARMPHTRERYGRMMPLQTPQAFTNRAHRFRVPNQIPASNPKNGSATYMEAIKRNLGKTRSETTEGLSTLSQGQIKKVKKANEGKFKENSRYVVKDKKPPETSPSSKKRKAHSEDEIESESEQETSRVKRHCTTRTPQNSGAEIPKPNDPSRESIYDDNNEASDLVGACFYVEESQNEEDRIPLFVSIGDRDLALVENPTFTSPYAVLDAQHNGYQLTRPINILWYRRSILRYVGPAGNIVEDVVHDDCWNDS